MLDTVRFTGRLIRKRPLRSLLTVLQLALGVWIVSIVLSLSLNAIYEDPFTKSLSDTLLQLRVMKEEKMGNHMVSMMANTFTPDDPVRLQEQSLYTQAAFLYEPWWSVHIESEAVKYLVSAAAEATPPAFQALGLELVEGAFFTQADVDQKTPVAVISQTISSQLFPGESPVGKKLKLSQHLDREVTIIGVYRTMNPALSGFVQESFLIIPLGVVLGPMAARMGGQRAYGRIFVQAVPGRISEAVEEAQLILADRVLEGMELQALSLAEMRAQTRSSIRTVTWFVGVFAFVAVVISSIGILSIMLVSVVERTREMGLRRALGASRLQIVGQVLNEALVFSLLGSAAGIGAAFFSSEYVSQRLFAQMYLPGILDLGGLNLTAVLITIVLAVATGQLFGLYPAIQAARITPVDALRDQ
ncbi:MAG: FtsX-like permease family protein [Firmicutes bacterium]|jgi:putative ABC transport system permease protein|nr:FtsX-like permease family protein [Bacillota bacterium]